MKEDVKTRWLTALRSGEYEQGTGQLRYDNKFCCLGVLCDIVDPDGWEENENRHDGRDTFPSFAVLDKSNLNGGTFVPNTNDDVLERLTRMNDNERRTFEEIADWIEENL